MHWARSAYGGIKRCAHAATGALDALLPMRRCPLCSARRQRLTHVTDWYYYLLCPECHLCYVGNAPPEPQVTAWYRRQTFEQQRAIFHCSNDTDRDAWDRWLEFKFQVFREIRLNTAAHHEKQSLLEIGCGEGLLLLFFRDQGWDVKGLELNPSLAQRLQRQGLDVSQQPIADFGDGVLYDLILMFHVLEHLHNPLRDLAKVRSLLAVGGEVVIETPVSRNYACTDHLFFFNSTNLRECLSLSGFRPVSSYQYVDAEHPDFTNLCIRCVALENRFAHEEVISCA